jgi:hypothetical protein
VKPEAPWFVVRYRTESDISHLVECGVRDDLYREVNLLVQRGIDPDKIHIYRRTEAQVAVSIEIAGHDVVTVNGERLVPEKKP